MQYAWNETQLTSHINWASRNIEVNAKKKTGEA